ncbi:amidohydrolase family protein [Mycolicibacterium mageritense]|uniref:amidohydrolase family protein n=1 Tax=Mycolicibacterium mageritense TaxID=53462 RepID=UPI0011DBD46B|nr:amidohydrolase family protein [Mycolicibacterium mageritense]TXI61597.1 MAG: amidohydrolase [Mycolicibacterium mageritense]
MNHQRIIAVEEHVATEEYLQIAHRLDVTVADRTEVGLMRTIETGPVRSALTDIDARIATMDAVGQDMAILSINPPGVQPYPAARAVSLAQTANDSLAEIVRDHPERFGALGTVAPQDPTAAADEIERIMGPLGLNGIMINSHTGGHYLDEPRFTPLLDAATQHNAPIYLHPRMFSVAGPYDDYGMQAAVWGYQAEAGLHAMRLILSGVFDRYPGLTVVLGHLGEGIPYWLRRIDNRHAYTRKIAGAAGDAPELELAPSEYFRRNFVITTSGIDDTHVLDLALHAVGDDNIMFAIDAPYEETADAVAFLRTAPLTERQRDSISHRTAQRVFGLPA